MHTDLLAAADALSDQDLLVRVQALAGNERATTAELVAHLGVLDTRPSLYAAGGYGSLFAYCTEGLRLSEDAAYSRVEAARACRRYPKILELLVSGALTLTAVRLIGRHLTADNQESVIARLRTPRWPNWRRSRMYRARCGSCRCPRRPSRRRRLRR